MPERIDPCAAPPPAATKIRPARVRFVLMVSLIAGVLLYLSLMAFGGLMRLGGWTPATINLIEQFADFLIHFYTWPTPALWWICFLSWLYRTANNARYLDDAASAPPGAEAVAVWLIPFVNLIMPFLHMEAIWRASHGAERGAALPRAWWVLCLCVLGLGILYPVPPEIRALVFAAAMLAFLAVVVSIQRAHEAAAARDSSSDSPP